MKSLIFIFLGLLFCQLLASQEIKQPEFRIGIGVLDELNIGNGGPYIISEAVFSISERLSVNPGISFFQSTFITNDVPWGKQNHSGLFLDLQLGYSVIKNDAFGFAVKAGSSYQRGYESYREAARYVNDILVYERYTHNDLKRFGLIIEFEFELLSNDRFSHYLSLQAKSFNIFPEMLSVSYKFGFHIK
ncbi:hypothetical protein ACE1ET_09990 [Saccharicrinis sp. FJH62]|uniref:hypothetical protein n=1 Tax=Saccharicrinis sp. FJH62 TaxID=3344657 RepID=UPI0035D3F2F6